MTAEDLDRDIFVQKIIKLCDIKVDEAETVWYDLTEHEQQFPRLSAILYANKWKQE